MDEERFDERLDEFIVCPGCSERLPYWWYDDNDGCCPECGTGVTE